MLPAKLIGMLEKNFANAFSLPPWVHYDLVNFQDDPQFPILPIRASGDEPDGFPIRFRDKKAIFAGAP
jgi:hypothetical protein